MHLDLWLIKIPSCPAAWLFVDSEIPTPSPIRTAFWDIESTLSSLPLYAPALVEGGIIEYTVYVCLYILIYTHTRC